MIEFFKRTITGFLYVIVILGSLLLGKDWFFGVLLVLNFFAMKEFYRILSPERNKNLEFAGILSGTLIISSEFLYASGLIESTLFISLLVFSFTSHIIYLLDTKISIHSISHTFSGLIYIALPLTLSLAVSNGKQMGYNPLFMISIFCLIWANDTGAYLIGIWLGKHKIWPSLSPKKSWEGFFGGIIFTLVAGILLHRWIPFGEITQIKMIILAGATSILSVIGDFIESALKRNANIKDSGNLLPGHGGILDRIDSLLIVMPFIFILMQSFNV